MSTEIETTPEAETTETPVETATETPELKAEELIPEQMKHIYGIITKARFDNAFDAAKERYKAIKEERRAKHFKVG